MDGSRSFERESVVAALWSARDYARTKEARLLSRLMYSRRKKREKEKGKKRRERGECGMFGIGYSDIRGFVIYYRITKRSEIGFDAIEIIRNGLITIVKIGEKSLDKSFVYSRDKLFINGVKFYSILFPSLPFHVNFTILGTTRSLRGSFTFTLNKYNKIVFQCQYTRTVW